MLNGIRIALALLLASISIASASAQERVEGEPKKGDRDYPFAAAFPSVQARVEALLDVFREEAPRGNIDEWEARRDRADSALVRLGKAAAPKLLDEVARSSDVYPACERVLIKMGKPAVDEVRARWLKMSHEVRWRLMEFRGRHDYDQAADYALWCLTVDSLPLRSNAWGFLLEHKEKRVKEEFFRNLRGESAFPPHVSVLSRDPVFDNEKEIDLLIALLDADSWAARDVGEPHIPRTLRYRPEDQREFVIDALKARKAKRAAPALLTLLAERGPGRAYFGPVIIPLLGEYGHKEAVPELKRILETDDKQFAYRRSPLRPFDVKLLAARVLMQFGDAKGRDFLKPEIVKSGSRPAAAFIAASYAQYGDKSDIPLLAKWLDHPFWEVQRAACEGLERITG
ncbi:MAG: HEAT repeat domain-containing protein, partial [Gemmataceae bacterium]